MAITLITGTPGSGKTLYAVWLMEKLHKSGRRLVVDGIKDLALEHELVDEPWIRDWWGRCQAEDIIVVDEVQRIWPPQSVSVKPTEDIEKLHVHRHKGVDFIIITQHPQRLHKTIRDLVGRHVHVRRMFGLKQAMVYEWDHCHNPNSGFRDAVKSRWGYPRSVFKLYTSAEVHTKQKAVVPKALYAIPLCLAFAMFFGWRGYNDVLGKKKAAAASAQALAAGGASSTSASSSSNSSVGSKVWRVVGGYALQGRGFVLLADEAGRVRSVQRDGFSGDGVLLEGKVDGDRVGVWTGGADVPAAPGDHK